MLSVPVVVDVSVVASDLQSDATYYKDFQSTKHLKQKSGTLLADSNSIQLHHENSMQQRKFCDSYAKLEKQFSERKKQKIA